MLDLITKVISNYHLTRKVFEHVPTIAFGEVNTIFLILTSVSIIIFTHNLCFTSNLTQKGVIMFCTIVIWFS